MPWVGAWLVPGESIDINREEDLTEAHGPWKGSGWR
jgi:hypothetical protein